MDESQFFNRELSQIDFSEFTIEQALIYQKAN
jgi:hypothetical protein